MPPPLDRAACLQALNARDPRFDGVFFVGIATTGIYCRPVCPSRVARDENRRFYPTAAAAEASGFRPCLRCRPELSPGRAPCDAVYSLAATAAHRIAAGALNDGSVADLAAGLGVSVRHLRRALQREAGVAPLDLAQTHRLLLAKRLLADTDLPVTQVAYAAGFQSLRRFHAAWRDRYGLSPTALRRAGPGPRPSGAPTDALRLSLAYRAPLAWDALLEDLHRRALPGVEAVEGSRYLRTVRLGDHVGTVAVAPSPRTHRTGCVLDVDLSLSLLPALMPLLAGLRRLFDLDAEPARIDAALAASGLADAVRQHPGLRVPGALDGFEATLAALLTDPDAGPGDRSLAKRVVATFGDSAEAAHPDLDRHPPTAHAVAEAGPDALAALGVPPGQARRAIAYSVGRLGGSRPPPPCPPHRSSPRSSPTSMTRDAAISSGTASAISSCSPSAPPSQAPRASTPSRPSGTPSAHGSPA